MYNLLSIALIACTLLQQIHLAAARAADFKVENKVFSGADKNPSSQTTTIFRDGLVYDYLFDNENPAEIEEVTIFDFARGQFTLLDNRQKLKTELSTKLVKAAIESLKSRNDLAGDPFTNFLINPSFEKKFNEAAGELVFNSPWLDYRVLVSHTEDSEIAQDYRRFCDWYAHLNAFVRPGSTPPFARLLVNEELHNRGSFPREVHLTLKPKQGLFIRGIRLRSEHKLTPRLGEADHRLIAQTADDLPAFKMVGFKEYNQKQDRR